MYGFKWLCKGNTTETKASKSQKECFGWFLVCKFFFLVIYFIYSFKEFMNRGESQVDEGDATTMVERKKIEKRNHLLVDTFCRLVSLIFYVICFYGSTDRPRTADTNYFGVHQMPTIFIGIFDDFS